MALSEADLQADVDRRRPGTSQFTSQRREPDTVRILSGIFEGKTTGTPIGLMVENEDQRVAIEQPRVNLAFRKEFGRGGKAHHQPRRLNQMIGIRALSRMRPRPHS